jgi:hypothetical protein
LKSEYRSSIPNYEYELNAKKMNILQEPSIPKLKAYRFRHHQNNLFSDLTRIKKPLNKVSRWQNKPVPKKRIDEAIRKPSEVRTSAMASLRTISMVTQRANVSCSKFCIGILVIRYKKESFYATANLRIDKYSDLVGIVTSSTHFIKKQKLGDK